MADKTKVKGKEKAGANSGNAKKHTTREVLEELERRRSENNKAETETKDTEEKKTKQAADQDSGAEAEQEKGSAKEKEAEAGEKETKAADEKKESAKKDKKDEKIEELNDKLMRQMAEFENFRKRTEKEKTQMFDMGAKSVIEKLLPVVDNFERGLAGAPEGDAFADGMSMIYKQILTMFEGLGVEEIEAEGKPFDPEIHNAVMHIDDEAYGENEVVEVLQKGYKFHSTVVRHSMVKVAN